MYPVAEKENDRLVLRRGFQIKASENFVIGEDVVTRGGRVRETIDIVREHGGNIVAVGVVVNRSGGQARFGCPLYSLLEMAPETYEPENCPLCASGNSASHPGS